ncbi:methionine synthase, partial [Bacteroides thetaiotaomicron]
MIEQELTYQDLRILSSEIYEAMGYKDSIPDQMVIDETNTLLKRVIPLLRPRFAFFFMEGTLDIEKETLSVQSIHPPTVNPIQDT